MKEALVYTVTTVPAVLLLQATPTDPIASLLNLGGVGALSAVLLYFYRQDRKASQDQLADIARENAAVAERVTAALERNSAQIAQLCEMMRERIREK